MIYAFEDPVRDWDRYCEDQDKREARLPHCDCCGNAIYEKFYNIDGDILCEECMEDAYMHYVEEENDDYS